MHKLLKVIVVIILMATVGCTTTRSISTMENSYEGMEIYSAKIPDKDFKEINFIEVRGGWPMGPKGLMNRLVERAKREGANGLINVRLNTLENIVTVSGTAVKFDQIN